MKFNSEQINEVESETIKSNIKFSCEQWRLHKSEVRDHGVNTAIDSAHYEYYRSNFALDHDSDPDDVLNELFSEAKEDGRLPLIGVYD